MNRRTFIGTVAVGLSAGLSAGCLGISNVASRTEKSSGGDVRTETRAETPSQAHTPTERPPAPYMFEMGDRVELSGATTVLLDSPTSTKRLQFEDGKRRSAPEGYQFLLVRAIARTGDGNDSWYPKPKMFSVKEGSERYWPEIDSIRGKRLAQPVSDAFYYISGIDALNVQPAGQLLFLTPADLSEDVAVVMSIQPASMTTYVGWRGTIEPL